MVVGCSGGRDDSANNRNLPLPLPIAKKSVAPPDPVGELFNDGPRTVITYSADSDPLAILFRDPVFIANLSSPTVAQKTVIALKEPDVDNAVQVEPAAQIVQKMQPEPSQLSPQIITLSPQKQLAQEQTPPNSRDLISKKEAQQIGPQSETSTVTKIAPIPTPSASNLAQTESAAPTPTSKSLVSMNGLTNNGGVWPVPGKPINVFGAKGPEGLALHGLFFKAPQGTPVKAIDVGQVVFSQPLKRYGNVVIVDHGRQYTSIYSYNSKLTKRVGDQVSKGETIALVGNTGSLPEPALYFEVRHQGKPISPSLFINSKP